MGEPFDLRVVPAAAVVAHEHADQHRVDKLIGRLEADGCLGNPPVVAEFGDRVAALHQLGYEYVIVQVASLDTLRLETWSHVLLDIEPDRLLDVLGTVDAVRLQEHGSGEPVMCTIELVDGRSLVVRPAGERHPFTALNPLVAAYLDATRIVRRITTDLESVVDDQPGTVGIVVFPRLSIDTVFAAARDGHRLPAGITRFLVAGRVIDLNASLAALREPKSLAEHNSWLHELIADRRAGGHIRHYPEAVFVLND